MAFRPNQNILNTQFNPRELADDCNDLLLVPSIIAKAARARKLKPYALNRIKIVLFAQTLAIDQIDQPLARP